MVAFVLEKFTQTTLYTYVIDYSNYVLEEEFKRFSKGHKWILNKVEKKSDLQVVKTDDVEEYLVESDKTYLRQGLKKPYFNDTVRKLYKEVMKRGMGTILKIVDSQNQIHAITFYLHNQKKYIIGWEPAMKNYVIVGDILILHGMQYVIFRQKYTF